MIRTEFSRWMDAPGLVAGEDLIRLGEIVSEHPWFTSGQVLLACGFHATESIRYPGQLKKAAAYAADRRILKEHIARSGPGQFPPVPLPFPAPETEEPGLPLPETVQVSITPELPSYERLTQEELLAIVKKRLAEIAAENDGKQDAGYGIHDEGSVTAAPVAKAALIDKFIRDEPKISRPRAVFFSPSESAIRSNFDDEEIVSETLAQLFANQGNVQKAIHIYQKLSLQNQEKSRYFAAQIEKLQSE